MRVDWNLSNNLITYQLIHINWNSSIMGDLLNSLLCYSFICQDKLVDVTINEYRIFENGNVIESAIVQ
jgi:hypothetical protein